MNAGRIAKNHCKIALNALWRKLTGRSLFAFDCRSILDKNFPVGSAFTFIQVGANDGVSNDFLYEFVTTRKAAGLVIEPVEEYFNKLVSNYKTIPSIVPLNIAVHATQKRLELFKVKPESLSKLPGWASGIASGNPRHHLASGIGKEHMHSVVVEADSFMNIVRPYPFLKKTDYLQIDIEGFDDEVIRQIDFAELRPKMIRFEYMNLTEEKTVETIRYLKRWGYHCSYAEVDVFAVQTSEVDL